MQYNVVALAADVTLSQSSISGNRTHLLLPAPTFARTPIRCTVKQYFRCGILMVLFLIITPKCYCQTQWVRDLSPYPSLSGPTFVQWDSNSASAILIISSTSVDVYNGLDGSLRWTLTPSKPASDWTISALAGCPYTYSYPSQTPQDLDGDGRTDVAVVLTSSQSQPYRFVIQLYDVLLP